MTNDDKETIVNNETVEGIESKTTIEALSGNSVDGHIMIGSTGIWYNTLTGNCAIIAFDYSGITLSYSWVPWDCPQGTQDFLDALADSNSNGGSGIGTGDGSDTGGGTETGGNGDGNNPSDGTGTPPLDGSGGGGNGTGTGDNTGDPNQNEDPNDQEEPTDCLETDENGNCVRDLTTPVVQLSSHVKNCEELQRNATDSVNQNMQTLKDAVLEGTEKAFGVYNGSHWDPPQPNPVCGPIVDGDEQNSGSIYTHPYLKAYVHNHLKDALFKHIGTFSTNDISNFSNMTADTNDPLSPIEQHELAYYLICDEGNYAIKVKDPNKLLTFNVLLNNSVFLRQIEKYYKNNNIAHGKPKQDQNIGFLKLIKEYDIGIELYEADENFENWERLELDSSQNDINRIHC